MSLTLDVLSFKGRSLAEPKNITVNNDVCTIGRSADSTLVLPDPDKFVSRQHATIKLDNGYYYLTDSSLGGVFIDNQDIPVHNRTAQIFNGSLLKVGEYEIAVTIIDEQSNDFSFAGMLPAKTPEPMAQEDTRDDFPFPNPFLESQPEPFIAPHESLVPADVFAASSLMSNNQEQFAKHKDLVEPTGDEPRGFESQLIGNVSPLYDSFIAPAVTTGSDTSSEIPENFSFEDLLSGHDELAKPYISSSKAKPDVMTDDDFGLALKAAAKGLSQEKPEALIPETTDLPGLFASEALSDIEKPPVVPRLDRDDSLLKAPAHQAGFDHGLPKTPTMDVCAEESKIHLEKDIQPPAAQHAVAEKMPDSDLFLAFLQGAKIDNGKINPKQLTETMHRVGEMFRQFAEGTVAVLRSRAEFKSLFRASMTVIKASDNNPLKFGVSTDDVVRQLIENRKGGFEDSVVAIEEGFNDIMNHQLAMQAGIQASLHDLLKTFDPRLIEQQFEQGLVLQKKAKCWEKYEATYKETVEDAVENFFGSAFIEAYENQMKALRTERVKDKKLRPQ